MKKKGAYGLYSSKEGLVYFGRVAYRCLKGRYILGGRVAHICSKEWVGIFWEGWVYSGRKGYILRGSLLFANNDLMENLIQEKFDMAILDGADYYRCFTSFHINLG